MLPRIRTFLPRELNFAKRTPNSAVRREVCENAILALCVLRCHVDGEIEPESVEELERAYDAVKAAIEVLT